MKRFKLELSFDKEELEQVVDQELTEQEYKTFCELLQNINENEHVVEFLYPLMMYMLYWTREFNFAVYDLEHIFGGKN